MRRALQSLEPSLGLEVGAWPAAASLGTCYGRAWEYASPSTHSFRRSWDSCSFIQVRLIEDLLCAKLGKVVNRDAAHVALTVQWEGRRTKA